MSVEEVKCRHEATDQHGRCVCGAVLLHQSNAGAVDCDTLTKHVCDGNAARFHVYGRSGLSYGPYMLCEWAVRNERRLGFTCVAVLP